MEPFNIVRICHPWLRAKLVLLKGETYFEINQVYAYILTTFMRSSAVLKGLRYLSQISSGKSFWALGIPQNKKLKIWTPFLLLALGACV